MYTTIYNRLCGWVFFALGIMGLCVGHIGIWIHLTTGEGIAYTALGIVSMAAARIRHRDATLVAVLLGIILFLFGLAGFVWPTAWFGTSEPLESALRLVAGFWGMYVAVHDVMEWRNVIRASA